jgi:hypothetical protein
MENIILTNNNTLGIAGPVAQKVTPPPEVKVTEVTPRKDAPSPELNLKDAQHEASIAIERRLELLKRIANLYAVSDTRFTIYKQNGEYYTRITNLRDGKVVTIPEPSLLTKLGAGSLLETSV